ncbi:hypothetical protein VaNZ11_008412 [Volvox africanus]|uniref:Uncharacterized protein n=1 Tax=Volvox africanus TaxID=51714 RepID=A0ABQ5S6M1_9CHLO|nr:hypothetical protein VaNZ11_008412 [Volvox africanus]
MSSLAKALLVLNTCCESTFVIHARLSAQNISKESGRKALVALADGVFSQGFLNEIFTSQQPMAMSILRGVIEVKVNQGNMKITGSSMDKLFDLVVSMFKYQVVRSWKPEQLIEITNRHLSEVLDILESYDCSRTTLNMVMDAQIRVKATFDKAGAGELHRIRQALLRVLQEQRIKVSVLIQANAQNNDASFVLAPPCGDRVGTISLYDESGNVIGKERQPIDKYWLPSTPVLGQEIPLGSNLFGQSTCGSEPQSGTSSLHEDVHIVQPNIKLVIDQAHANAPQHSCR